MRVFVLGRGDFPLAAPVDITDPVILQAVQRLIEEDAAQVRLTPSATRMLRAIIRTGVANLQRVLSKKLLAVDDDGHLHATQPKGKAQAVALQTTVQG